MKRRRFFESLTAALPAVLMIAGGFAFAAPPEGKGGGKNKDDSSGDVGTTDSPPLTFMVHWLPEEVAAYEFTNQGNAIGDLAATAADGSMSSETARFHNGVVYDINGIVNDSAWIISLVKEFGDRNDEYFYVTGIGLPDGVARSCRLTLAEGVNGGSPALADMLTLPRLPGDTRSGDSRSGAAAVNSSGNVIVMSTNAEDAFHDIYVYNAETGQQVPNSEFRQTSDAYHARLNELVRRSFSLVPASLQRRTRSFRPAKIVPISRATSSWGFHDHRY